MMKWPVAAVGFLTTTMGATPDEGHKYVRRLRAITVKHMGDLWAAQMTRRREADDSKIMEDLQRQWHGVRKFAQRIPTWTAVSKTHDHGPRPGQRLRSGEPAYHAANPDRSQGAKIQTTGSVYQTHGCAAKHDAMVGARRFQRPTAPTTLTRRRLKTTTSLNTMR